MDKKVSEKTISRMTLYHCILTDYIIKEIDTISSPQIATLLKIDDSQVRKDISFLNNSGKCRVGYLVKELKASIEKTLGFSKPKNAIIIGAGNLGNALANYSNFSSYGLNVLALFDTDKNKIGKIINGKSVYSINEIKKLTTKIDIDMAILTVPREFAQETANLLVKENIKYIWNFSPAVLDVPQGVEVWNENLMGNFLQFAYKMQD